MDSHSAWLPACFTPGSVSATVRTRPHARLPLRLRLEEGRRGTHTLPVIAAAGSKDLRLPRGTFNPDPPSGWNGHHKCRSRGHPFLTSDGGMTFGCSEQVQWKDYGPLGRAAWVSAGHVGDHHMALGEPHQSRGLSSASVKWE